MKKAIDMTGKKFNRLTVIKRVYREGCKKVLWLCKCDCGELDIVEGYALRNDKVKSCGCLREEAVKAKSITHGLAHTPIYNVWCSMKARCMNSNNEHYSDYGGRGIKVCDEWRHDFTSFYNWAIENGFNEGLTLDRKNVNGNYEPSNCRWVDMQTQQNNRRDNRKIKFEDEEYSISEFARKLSLPYDYVYARLARDYKSERQRSKERKENKCG